MITSIFRRLRNRTKVLASIGDVYKRQRHYSQPDCNWGWDSHRECYFFGSHLYMYVASDSHSDLPVSVSYTHLDVYKRQVFENAVEEFLRPKIHTETKKYKSPVENQVSKTLITTGDSYFKI